MTKANKPVDPVKPGQRRCLCVWILNPHHDRCPRKIRTGEACWCRAVEPADKKWPWRVVPPLAARDRPGWNYDQGFPLLIDDDWKTQIEEVSK